MENSENINQRIAERVRTLRNDRHLSLAALAARSGVSRSMISVIERGESSPTAVVLERLATALGTTMAGLFEVPGRETPLSDPISRREDQVEWQDPASGYRRRNISPPHIPQPMQIVEVSFPPGARVAFDTGSRPGAVYQQIWLLEGNMEITVGDRLYALASGDCLAMQLDRPMMFFNPTNRPARYAVVITNERTSRE